MKTFPELSAVTPYKSVPSPSITPITESVVVSITKRSRSGTSGSRTMRVSEPGMFGLSSTKSARSSPSSVHWGGFPGGVATVGHSDSSLWLPDSNAATKSRPPAT
jgi:hypothetical protein